MLPDWMRAEIWWQNNLCHGKESALPETFITCVNPFERYPSSPVEFMHDFRAHQKVHLRLKGNVVVAGFVMLR